MTQQFADVITIDGIDYQIIRDSHEGLFTPATFGIKPKNTRLYTALYSGYLTRYTCYDNALILRELHIHCDDKPDKFPTIGGVKPRREHSQFIHTIGVIYDNLDIQSQYSGGLLIGKLGTENRPFYINFYAYHIYTVFEEWIFDNGTLQQRLDYSSKMANIRKKLEAMPMYKPGEVPDEFHELMEQRRTGYAFDYFPHWSNKQQDS